MKHPTRSADTAEIFTPRSLVREMLGRLDQSAWFDPAKTWLEPSAGDGNFLVEIQARLLQASHDPIHVRENMLFSIELLPDNHFVLQQRLKYIELKGDKIIPLVARRHFDVVHLCDLAKQLGDFNPYAGRRVKLKTGWHTLTEYEVYQHRNHKCSSALDPGAFEFGARKPIKLPTLPIIDLDWNTMDTDTPGTNGQTIVSLHRGTWNVPPATPGVAGGPASVTVKDASHVPLSEARKLAPARMKKIKQPREPSGGWGVNYDDYGKGLKVRTKSPIDGVYWVADHDELVDAINKSLESKGLEPLSQNKRRFGASGGVRPGLFRPEA